MTDPRIDAHDELSLIALIAERIGPPAATTVLGPGDDAAVIDLGGRPAVLTIDAAVEGVHFRTDWCSAVDVGTRIAAASLSDVNAMGATCHGLVASLVLPGETPLSWLLGLIDGLRDEAAKAGAQLVGGDLAAGPTVVVTTAALGSPARRRTVDRSGAQPGQVVAVAGRLGWAAAGFSVLSRGFRTPLALVGAFRRPAVDYRWGPRAAREGATSLIDVSDGLLLDASRIATASGVALAFERTRLTPDEPLTAVASAMNVDPLLWVLGGGDDHALLGTFPETAGLPVGFRAVGRVLAEPVGAVLLDGTAADPVGYRHYA
ncbi:MAG: thiamine-phosphate kinase [Actinomycetales bacterium]|nr:thiamine-phosphate kinase [Actinomycetales bacterium]